MNIEQLRTYEKTVGGRTITVLPPPETESDVRRIASSAMYHLWRVRTIIAENLREASDKPPSKIQRPKS